ncbi:MAG: alpha-L-fucosidase [Sedimentisphaerales bacterium]|nr:alpha-L-fucosidase [Sedimentisphaerales bacterium]
MKNRKPLWIAIVAVAAVALGADAQEKYEPTWESLSKVNVAPQWFRDAKFGIYFHWGTYSVPAFGSEWYPRNMYNVEGREYRHHVETWGEPNAFGYPDFVPMFKAEKFNADEWVELFVQAGARFAGPVAEHHDGWSMWASKLTPWNAAERGPQRDLTGELAAAVRKRGLKFITTFHHARNNLWEKPGRDGQLRWTGHYEFVKRYFPSLLEDPERAIMYGYMPREKFLTMWLGKLQEVIDNYQPDIMWFDSWLDEIPESLRQEYVAYYYNQATRWGKEVVVTRKQNDLPLSVSIEDIEKGRSDRLTENVWLTDDTISVGSWCYTQDLRIKPTSVVLHSLIDIISKNGVLLLNISPMADGTIPDNQEQVLLEMGEWLRLNGEAVYGTRPWKVYGEGPSQGRAGQFGGVTDPRGGYKPQDVRFTTKGETLYAISLGWPDATLTIESLKAGSPHYPSEIGSVELIGTDARLAWTRTADGLTIAMPPEKPCDYAVVFKILPKK